MSTFLEVRHLGRNFGGVRALHDVNLTVSLGEVVGIMGANGAGKTTLFALIAGNLRPGTGDILLDDSSIVGLSPDRICRRGVGRTFQTARPFGDLTVLENIITAARFGMHRLDAHAAEKRAVLLLDIVGLGTRRNQISGDLTLSGQKRLEVARAVATGARLLLLDEVMAGLTPTEVAQMLEVVQTLKAENSLTILIIEHVMRALMRISDRILVLHHGEAIACNAPAEIARDPRVLDCYLGLHA
ncbi:ABC transporter ATP-binding protein [Pusillimonas caeni]|uniref:ABC transporter ATP-binding protein n=1 Tax=Pusillimonas caeni TaxID=1348472 RepID=UPI000E59B654|nr:ABC transporter ATP-binding protein [Pusillimonas caeni]TFL15533.1 ABC transporter ATP-binding protein [Pusillimonas caeni]